MSQQQHDDRALAEALFPGDGEMARRCRTHDWAATALGPITTWPPSLRTAAAGVIASGFPGIVLWGPTFVKIYNDGYVPILGVRHPAALGRASHEVWPELRDVVGPVYERAVAGETVSFADRRYVLDRNGPGAPPDTIYVTVTYAPIRDETGAVRGVSGAFFETTNDVRGRQLADEREHLLRYLEEERAHSGELLESMSDAYFVLDGDYRYTAVNSTMERRVGLTRDQLLGRTLWEMFPGAVGSVSERAYRQVVRDRVEAHFTHDYRDERIQLVVDVDAYPTGENGVAVFWRDVTDRVRADEALRDSEAKYRGLFASMDQGFCIVEMLFDDEGRAVDYRFLEANRVFEGQTGLVDVVGRTARELVPGLEQHWFDTYGRVALTGEPTRFQNVSEPMGRWFDVYAFRIGEPAERRVAVLFNDVSAQVAAHKEIERLLGESERARADAEVARAQAESANRAKAQFLATMSHELRTPLNAIGGYAELIELGIHGPVSAEQRADLERIQRSQRHLLGLINGVLNYARVEAGAVHYDVSDVPLDAVLATCEALVSPQVRAKRQTFALSACDGTRLRARADREKLQQVILNLLSNAVKFTDVGGHIALSCDAVGAVVRVRVADTGIGIAPDQLARVFEPFVQVDANLTRTQEGTGLGLAISRDLARGMGGDLTVESVLGGGSTFTLTLPSA